MEPDRALAPGDVVAGKYLIENVLGHGGMGYVLGARNIALDEPVAIKILKPDAVGDEVAVARFFREARASVRMKGEHVAKVLDVGALDDGTPYMLMERLTGDDLSTVVERSGPLPVQVAVDYVLQICEALAEAHALGIVHRDIKPSNLFLTTGVDGMPCVKVLDFGISKATNAIDATRPDFGLTQTQTVMGSPQYMAPEQMRSSRRVDGRTDIWGLGTIMHELLTGQPPFVSQAMPELFAMILQDPAPSMRGSRPDVPPELDAIVLRCLEKAPDARPQDVQELARLLMPFAGSLSAGAAERVARVGQTVALASATLIADRESGRALVAPTPRSLPAQAVGKALHRGGAAPPGRAMATLAETHVSDVTRRPRANRTALVVGLAAISTIVAGAVTAGVLIASKHKASEATPIAASAAGPTSAAAAAAAPTVANEPPAIDPPPPATLPPLPAPPASHPTAPLASHPPVSATSSAPPVATAKRALGGARATAGGTTTMPSPSSPPASATRTAEPPKPAATASSRFD